MIRMVLLAGLFMVLPLTAAAQFGGVEPLEISINPSYPRPYQTISVQPSSTLIDLAASRVTISANGSVVGEGSGSAAVNVTLGGPGSVTTIRITAVQGGQTYTKELRVRPADVALIIEPTTTTHPFYRGGAGVSSEAPLRIIAMPDLRNASGVRIDPATLVYTWKLGDRLLEAQSGIGKSSLSATAPIRYRDTLVSLTVATTDSSIVAQASTLVAPIDPIVRIYRSDPLLGPLFDVALAGTVSMRGEEETFRAVPYHFANGPALTWLVNGSENGSASDITLRSTGQGGGTASLVAQAKQVSTYVLGEARLTLRFGEERGGLGIFGL